ncbi:MAG: cobyrinate a,c-diamide synthase [Gammaproteobacteria bacterium]
MAHVLISAAHKSSGKTTVSIGLCAALRARRLAVQPFKKGPDYIDPMWLGLAAGRPCYNLDYYTMRPEEIGAMFAAHSATADVSIIEGNKGLYDGLDLDGSNSNAALAKLLGTPVVLVIDARGMTRGIAPLILGYQAFDPDIRIAGVVLNQLGGARHEAKLRAVIEHYTGVPVLGAVHRDTDLSIDERHLGLVPSNESAQAARVAATLGSRMAEQIDLDALLGIASSAPAPSFPVARPVQSPAAGAPLRVGVMRDSAFGFYYPDDLEALRACGAELVFVDALHDRRLPALDAMFIGGGFPETHMSELAANTELRGALREAIAGGLPTYAECGGLMYLCRNLRWQDRTAEMVGVIPADAVMYERPQGRGYVRLAPTGAGPWANEPAEIAAHEFHYSRLENVSEPLRYAYRVLRGTGVDGEHDGIVRHNLLANYTHLRHTSANPWTDRFVQFARQMRARRSGTSGKGGTSGLAASA